jgi:hypothetical protein
LYEYEHFLRFFIAIILQTTDYQYIKFIGTSLVSIITVHNIDIYKTKNIKNTMKTLAIIFATILFFGSVSNATATEKDKPSKATSTQKVLRTEILSLIEESANAETNTNLIFGAAQIDADCISNMIEEDAKNEESQNLELTKTYRVTGSMATLFERNAAEQINTNLTETKINVDYLTNLIEQNTQAEAQKTVLK